MWPTTVSTWIFYFKQCKVGFFGIENVKVKTEIKFTTASEFSELWQALAIAQQTFIQCSRPSGSQMKLNFKKNLPIFKQFTPNF